MTDVTNNKVNNLPAELITNKTLYTLTGASASVWIVCLVIHSICSKSITSPDIYKLIALIVSLLISINFVLKKKNKKYEDWLLAVLNAFLIFIYATGFNTISSNIFTEGSAAADARPVKGSDTLVSMVAGNYTAGFLGFSDINWFPDKKLVKENKNLKANIDSLTAIAGQFDSLRKTVAVSFNLPVLLPDSALIKENDLLKKQVEELRNDQSETLSSQSADKDSYIRELEKQISTLKAANSGSHSVGNSMECLQTIDSLKRNLNQVISQQKTDKSQALNEIEKWRKKYLECIESKQSY